MTRAGSHTGKRGQEVRRGQDSRTFQQQTGLFIVWHASGLQYQFRHFITPKAVVYAFSVCLR